MFSFEFMDSWNQVLVDVKIVFVNAPLHEEIYVEQPNGFPQKDRRSSVCVLREVSCGLCQGSRVWHQYLYKLLVDIFCAQCVADPTLYVLMRYGSFVFFAVHVDGISLLAAKGRTFQLVTVHFEKSFGISVSQKSHW